MQKITLNLNLIRKLRKVSSAFLVLIITVVTVTVLGRSILRNFQNFRTSLNLQIPISSLSSLSNKPGFEPAVFDNSTVSSLIDHDAKSTTSDVDEPGLNVYKSPGNPVVVTSNQRLLSDEYLIQQIKDSYSDVCPNSILAEDINLDNQEIKLEPVERESSPTTSSSGGEVLQASDSISPAAEECKGYRGDGERPFLCRDTQLDIDVIDSDRGQSSIRYNENCKVYIKAFTIPSFFYGIDDPRNGQDGRINPFIGEIADLSNAGTGTASSVQVTEQGIVPGDCPKCADRPWSAPLDYVENWDGASFRTDILVTVVATDTSGGSANLIGGLKDVGDTQHSSTDSCETYGSDPSQNCSATGSQFILASEANIQNILKVPGDAKGEPVSSEEDDTCEEPSRIVAEAVRYNLLCLDETGIIEGWIYNFVGAINRNRCAEVEDPDTGEVTIECTRNVYLNVFAEDLWDSRIEEYSDFRLESGSPPDDTLQEGDEPSNYGDREDNYIATPGVCSACGQDTICWILWRDYRREFWEEQRRIYPPTVNCSDPSSREYQENLLYCDFEEYAEYIDEHSGGQDPDDPPG